MVWLIATFADLSVSCIAKKYLIPGKVRKCYYPKKNATAKIKAAVDVDKKSGEWLILPCRILMNGEEFATYSQARKAEKIAQNHSTMSSFQRSFSEKQRARKRPVVHFNSSSSSSSESESQDFKNIRKLSKLDAGLTVDEDKEYDYNSRPDKNNDNGPSVSDDNQNSANDENRPLASDDNESLCNDDNESLANDDNASLDNDDNRSLANDDNRSLANDDNRSSASGDNRSWNISENLSMDQDGGRYSDSGNDKLVDNIDFTKEDNNDSNIDDSEGDDDSESDDDSSSDVDDNLLITEPDNNRPNDSTLYNEIHRDYTVNLQLESTNREQSLVDISSPQCSSYKDFSDARRLPFIEKGVFCACQQLEENKAVLNEIKEISADTKVLIQSLMPVIKDLTVEVFDSKEEIKKRNGMFTDLLAPDVQLSIENVKQFDDAIAALEKHKNVDNLIKYLGSTINESKEKCFIKSCLGVVFQTKFFMKKVWWKNKPGKVNIKNSQILHCIRESFKTKFGLVEPKKSDKEIDKLIYNVGRNMKDSYRKTKKVKKEENARKALEDDMIVKTSKKKQGKGVVKEVERDGKLLNEDVTEKDRKTAKKNEKASKNKTNEQAEVDRIQRNKMKEQDEEVRRNIERKARKAAKKAAKRGGVNEGTKGEQVKLILTEKSERGGINEGIGDRKAAKKAAKRGGVNELTEGEPVEPVLSEESERGGINEGIGIGDIDANEVIQKTGKKASKKAKFEQYETTETETNNKKRGDERDDEAERNAKKAKKSQKDKHGIKGKNRF